jgi:alkanesulfonate monooxygenase SsuD/methylene tetrahydromethanopterin reductase-like flavin-dependent oxidoreductase (luciferase family)
VGLGWNAVEYEALGKDFTDRGRRMTEQVKLLRLLWTQRVVTFDGRYERVTAAGLNPLPVQRPIPIWFGAYAPAALRRAGRLADGWFPNIGPGPQLDDAIAIVRSAAEAAGRDPDAIGMEGRVPLARVSNPVTAVGRWREANASHVSINTMGMGATGVDGHLAALAEVASALGLAARPS